MCLGVDVDVVEPEIAAGEMPERVDGCRSAEGTQDHHVSVLVGKPDDSEVSRLHLLQSGQKVARAAPEYGRPRRRWMGY